MNINSLKEFRGCFYAPNRNSGCWGLTAEKDQKIKQIKQIKHTHLPKNKLIPITYSNNIENKAGIESFTG